VLYKEVGIPLEHQHPVDDLQGNAAAFLDLRPGKLAAAEGGRPCTDAGHPVAQALTARTARTDAAEGKASALSFIAQSVRNHGAVTACIELHREVGIAA
jgi:hypothetical protein